MINTVQFKNYKVLRDTTLPLSQFTLLVGPNGSGKSTALAGIKAAAGKNMQPGDISTGAADEPEAQIRIVARFGPPVDGLVFEHTRNRQGAVNSRFDSPGGHPQEDVNRARNDLLHMPVSALDSDAIAAPVQLEPVMTLTPKGGNLAGVFDRMRDNWPETFGSFNAE